MGGTLDHRPYSQGAAGGWGQSEAAAAHIPSPRAFVRAVLAKTDFSLLACAATLALQHCRAGAACLPEQLHKARPLQVAARPCQRLQLVCQSPGGSHIGREVLDGDPLALRVQQQHVFHNRNGGVNYLSGHGCLLHPLQSEHKQERP